MGNVLVNKQLYVLVAKNPLQLGSPLMERDFAVDPAENLSISDYNLDAGARFSVPANGALTLGLDSIALASFLAIKVDSDCGVTFINASGSSPIFNLKGGFTTALHMDFTGLTLTNSTSLPITGRFCAVGV